MLQTPQQYIIMMFESTLLITTLELVKIGVGCPQRGEPDSTKKVCARLLRARGVLKPSTSGCGVYKIHEIFAQPTTRVRASTERDLEMASSATPTSTTRSVRSEGPPNVSVLQRWVHHSSENCTATGCGCQYHNHVHLRLFSFSTVLIPVCGLVCPFDLGLNQMKHTQYKQTV